MLTKKKIYPVSMRAVRASRLDELGAYSFLDSNTSPARFCKFMAKLRIIGKICVFL